MTACFDDPKHSWVHIFNKKDIKFLPLGIQAIVHIGSHYDRIMSRYNQTNLLFWIETPLSKVLYTLLRITKLKWKHL